ncbi:MAG: ankyrin repeat domain-containing protein [Bacteroidota bacterium]
MRRPFPGILIIICSLLTALMAFSQPGHSLLTVIKNNDTAQVNSLLKNDADVSVADGDGDNALMYAALYSITGCMKQLLQKGADPNAKNKLGETAIMWCSHDIEKTKLLLQYKADVNVKTTDGNTPLLAAV